MILGLPFRCRRSTLLLQDLHPPFFFQRPPAHRDLHSFPTRRSSDLGRAEQRRLDVEASIPGWHAQNFGHASQGWRLRSEEHTSELQYVSISYAVFCLKKKNIKNYLENGFTPAPFTVLS